MAKANMTARAVAQLNKIGRWHVGGGLYLQVRSATSRSWMLRATVQGKKSWIGLGPAAVVPYEKARAEALKLKAQIYDGHDPVAERRKRKAAPARAAAAEMPKVMDAFLAIHGPNMKGVRAEESFRRRMNQHAPSLMKMNVAAITTAHVLKVIDPLVSEKPNTAIRLLTQIRKLWRYAKARGLCSGENPAGRDALDGALPPLTTMIKKQRRQHPALDYTAAPAFYATLSKRTGYAAQALRFGMLTALRQGEIINGQWSWVDFTKRTYVVPKEFMKAGAEHTVPLSDQAIALLAAVKRQPGNPFIFVGYGFGRGLAKGALLNIITKMKVPTTAHGTCRATFSTWAHEVTVHPHEVIELCLAHTPFNAVAMAYNRGDMLAKRRALMEDWAGYLCRAKAAAQPAGKVLPMRKAKAA
jgi:integrase